MQIIEQLGKIDIYLLDQVMKGRIPQESRILDAGCGNGRNSELFIRHNYEVYGIDQHPGSINQLKKSIANWNPAFEVNHFQVGQLENMPYESEHFDFIICSAVLHFCKTRDHFIELFDALIKVLKKGGILWFRMTTKHTIEQYASKLGEDVYRLPDGSLRYLLDRKVLDALMAKHQLEFLDPFKTVNVSDVRTMATVVLQKKINLF